MAVPNFDQATSIAALDGHTYKGFFPQQYCIGSVPHGGFVASCLLRVVHAHLAAHGQPDTVIAHIEYLQRTEVGPVVFVVDDVKRGSRTSVVHVTVFQHALLDRAPWTTAQSRRAVVAYLTNSALATEAGLSLPTRYPVPRAAPADLARLARDGRDDHWTRLPVPPGSYRAVMNQVQFYMPSAAPPPPAQRTPVVDMWVRLATGEHFTNTLLGFVADIWPYVVESYRPQSRAEDEAADAPFRRDQVFWYPTLALNLDVKKALPPAGVEWLFVRVSSKQIDHGRLDLEVVILDQDHSLVALSHHVSLILDASRNLAERSHAKKNNSNL